MLQQNTNVTGIKWTTSISRQQLHTDNFTLSDWSLCTWSWIRDRSGEITKVTPAPISPVSWKHRLFPPPVGIKIKQSSFIIAALMASSWFVLNERMLYTFFNIFHISLWYGKSFRFSSAAKGRDQRLLWVNSWMNWISLESKWLWAPQLGKWITCKQWQFWCHWLDVLINRLS